MNFPHARQNDIGKRNCLEFISEQLIYKPLNGTACVQISISKLTVHN